MAVPKVYWFGEFRFDPASRELWRGDRELSLQLKVFDCIRYLIENRDRAVGRDELIAAVWGEDVHLADSVLGKTVSLAREALGDTGEAQLCIKTIWGYGYRWVAPVEALETDSVVGTAPRTVPAVWRWSLLATVVLATLIVAGVRLQRDTGSSEPGAAVSRPAEGSIALLLPVTVGVKSAEAWMRLGLMDHIAERLRVAGQPMVPSDTVIAMTRGVSGEPDPSELESLGATTGARLILRARVERTSSRWRVSLRSLAGTTPPIEARGEADDVLAATRLAADRMALSLGYAPPPGPTVEPELETLLQRAEAAMLADRTDEARALIDEAPAALRRSPEARLQLARIEFRRFRLDAAEAAFERLLVEERGPTFRAKALLGLANVHFRREEYEIAKSLLTEAAALASRQRASRILGQIELVLAAVAQSGMDMDAARLHSARARVALESTGDVHSLATLDNNMGVLEWEQEHYPEAVAFLELAAERYASMHDVNEELRARASLILIHLTLLDVEAALELEPRLVELLAQTSQPAISALANEAKALLLYTTGQLTAAKDLLEDALSASEADDLQSLRVLALLLRAEQSLEEGNSALATRLVSELFELRTAGIAMLEEIVARAGLVSLRAGLDLRDQARAEETAVAMEEHAERSGAPSARIYAALGAAELAAAGDRNDVAESAYEHALSVAIAGQAPLRVLEVAQSYVAWLLSEPTIDARRHELALVVASHASAYAGRDYRAALLYLRIYQATGPLSAWRTALTRAQALAGERRIPAELLVAPEDAGQSSKHRKSVTLG